MIEWNSRPLLKIYIYETTDHDKLCICSIDVTAKST
jgi:hypothetical protein